MEPDPWQANLLRRCFELDRVLILASRQVGKSTVASALALLTAMLQPPALVLLVARSLRQSSELFRKVKTLYMALAGRQRVKGSRGKPTPLKQLDDEGLGDSEQLEQVSALSLEMANGSRIVSLPGKADNIVGYSAAKMVIIDEAARCPDELYAAVRPMLARSKGKLVALSSAYAKQGWFYEAWDSDGIKDRWHKTSVLATDCPYISPEFLEEELAALGRRLYDREYANVFSMSDEAAFDFDSIVRATATDLAMAPIF